MKQLIVQCAWFDYVRLFWEMVNGWFREQLPTNLVLQIMVAYLNEGMKVLLRVLYALTIMNYNQIIKQKNPTNFANIYNQCVTINQYRQKQFLKIAYSLNNSSLFYQPKDKQNSKSKYLCPSFKLVDLQSHHLKANDNDQSDPEKQKEDYEQQIIVDDNLSMLSKDEFQFLWQCLPSHLKLMDPCILLNYPPDGLSDYFRSCQNIEHSLPTLILIRTDNDCIFGWYMNELLRQDRSYQGDKTCFVFSINQKQIYPCKDYESLIYMNNGMISLGEGVNGPALQVDWTLEFGMSNVNDTFNNLRLHANQYSNQFNISQLQILTFI